jgi:hypothetical protein
LRKGNVPARASVARHLYGFSWFSAESLIRLALQDEDYRVREAAIYALCDLRELNAYQLMVEVLQDEDDRVREAATFGLRDCHDPAAVRMKSASKPTTCASRRWSRWDENNPEAIPVTREAINDPNPTSNTPPSSLLELAG